MRGFRPSLVAGAIALALCTGTASAQFSGTYIFGDSLSDAGQYGSRFTTNPGLTSPMYVGQNWGFVSTPSFQGGNDFAQGGALVNAPAGRVARQARRTSSIAQQVDSLIAKGPLDPNALYQIQGGGNNLLDAGRAVPARADHAGAAAGRARAGGHRPRRSSRQAQRRWRAVRRAAEPGRRGQDALRKFGWASRPLSVSWPASSIRRSIPPSARRTCASSSSTRSSSRTKSSPTRRPSASST